jgi:hypothetical protein
MAAQWPLVKAWLAALIPSLPGLSDVTVTTGPQTSGSASSRYVTVGYVADDASGGYQQLQSYDGSVWDEVGEVRTQIVAQSGAESDTTVETTAFAMADAIDAAIRADHTLGHTLAPNGTVETSVEVHSISNANGTATALVHVLRYTTTT